jgi:hypothetical protein
MSSITFPNRIRANRRLLRIFAVASAVLLVQGTLTAPRAEANTIVDIYQAVSVGIAWDLGSKICPIACPAAAVAAVVVINNNAATVAEKSIEYAKPGLLQMFTNWGATFFRP